MSPLGVLLVAVVTVAVGLAAFVVGIDRLGLWDRQAEGLTNDWIGALLIGTVAFASAVGLATRVPAVSNLNLLLYLGSLLLMAGTGLLVWALANVRSYRRLRAAAGSAAVHAAPGRVAVSGTVEATETVTGPFSGADAVCVETRITEDAPEIRNGTDVVHEETTRLPFSLVDSTGRVDVDPSRADLRLTHDVWAEVSPDDEIPAATRRYLDERGLHRTGEANGSMSHRLTGSATSRTYAERNLAVGDAAVVLGTVRREGDRLVVADGDPFVVKEGTLASTYATYRRIVVLGGPAGVGLLLVGAVAMGLVL